MTFIVLGIGDVGGNADVTKVGGYLGLATAIAAWYASFAAVDELDVRADGPARRPLGKQA